MDGLGDRLVGDIETEKSPHSVCGRVVLAAVELAEEVGGGFDEIRITGAKGARELIEAEPEILDGSAVGDCEACGEELSLPRPRRSRSRSDRPRPPG